MADDIAITVKNVSKDFVLPHEKTTSVKSAFTSLFSKKDRQREMQHALKDISFEVKKGEFFGIVGRNGSGKSTLLKILANIYQPTKGSIRTTGKLVPFIELGVGFNPELTGRENVFLNGAMLGFSRSEVDAMYNDIVTFAELERFMDQKLKNYSSGMQVRLAFSMATRSRADILLVDEVLAVGDADFQRKCFEYFRELKKNKKTVIFVSHDMNAVREYCDRAILIQDSKVTHRGTPEQIAEEYIKLFNSQTESVQNNDASQQRWGDAAAQYERVTIKIAEQLTLETEIIGKSTLNHPIFGFQISNSLGEPVCGTNTMIVQKKTGQLKAGQRQTVSWQLPNIFGDGNYTVDVAITHDDGVTQADWWHEAASFTIRNQETTPHIVSPKITCELPATR